MSTPETKPAAQKPPTFAENAASAVLLVQRAFALLAVAPRQLTASQRRHGLKFRKGAEPSIRVVANLSDTHGVVVPGFPTSEMRASLARAEALRTVRTALVGALAGVDDAIYKEQGTSYGTALTLYGMLKKVAHRHAEIHAKLAPVEEFFSYRHRKVRTERAKQQAEKDASHEAAPAVPGS